MITRLHSCEGMAQWHTTFTKSAFGLATCRDACVSEMRPVWKVPLESIGYAHSRLHVVLHVLLHVVSVNCERFHRTTWRLHAEMRASLHASLHVVVVWKQFHKNANKQSECLCELTSALRDSSRRTMASPVCWSSMRQASISGVLP